jgi:hypothetical protein
VDQSIISATAGLAGSLLGGMSTFAASWRTTRAQHRTQTTGQQAGRRESLYAEFINKASRHLVRAWGHQLQCPQGLVGRYSILERIRLTSSESVITAAERVMHAIIAAYSAPDRPYDELRSMVASGDVDSPLTQFSKACRAEMRMLSPADQHQTAATAAVPALGVAAASSFPYRHSATRIDS